MIREAPIAGLYVVEIKIHRDERGFFAERYQQERFAKLGLHDSLVQDNHSRSHKGVLRGLHYQTDPAQGKFIQVIRGSIFDVAVDMRKSSETYGKHFSIELSETNGLCLWVPYGFAHGFCALEESDVLYKVTGNYNPKTEGGIRWSDPALEIPWPIENPLVSAKDKELPLLKEVAPIIV